MAKMTKMAIIVVMEYYELALNMVFMGVFLKSSKNSDQTSKWFENWSNGLKDMAKTKNVSHFLDISFVFWAHISTDMWICLNFFGSSPVGLGRLIKAKYLMLKLFAQKSHTKH